jgi:simple sugar transport system ATP-binding protein
MRVPAAGTLSLGGERFEAPRWPDAAATRALGLAHVPEDRERVGLVHALPAWESVVLGHQWRARYCGRMGWLDAALIRGDAGDLMAHHDVRPPSPRGPTAALSEGNQQKLMLARELLAQPRVLLAGQPTRGVDIGAAESIHEWLRAVRDSGGTVLLVSADLDEVLALADRVLVMRHGAVVGERVVMGCDRAEVDRLVAGVGPAEPGQARGTAAARGLPGAADPHGAPSLVSTFDASRPGTRPPGGVRMPWTPGADA